MILFLVLLFIFYVVPALMAYLGVRHMFKNELDTLQPELIEFAVVFVPLLNWSMAAYTLRNALFKVVQEVVNSVDKLNKKIKNKENRKQIF